MTSEPAARQQKADSHAQRERALAQEIKQLRGELDGIHQSRLWRLGNFYWQIRRLLRVSTGTARQHGSPPVDISPSVATEAGTNPCHEPCLTPALALAASLAQANVPDVVCFPIIDWEFRFQRPQQLMSQFTQHGRRGFYLRTTFHQNGPFAIVDRIQERTFGLGLPGPPDLNLYEGTMDRTVLGECLRAFAELRRQVRVAEAISLVQLPFWAPLAFALRDRWGWRVVYDCMDNHGGFSTNDTPMLDLEDRLARDSDLLVTTADSLSERLSPLARRAILVPNAVDFEHFHQARSKATLAACNGPVIGYYGAISDWFDVDLVRTAALARPRWEFVLIGRTFGADVSLLQDLSNVHFLGEKPYGELPEHLHTFDVATIPFKRCPLTDATNPVKFYEYLSAGKPVVAVDLPELVPFREHFYPVREAEDFVPQIEAALAENSPARAQARIAFARQNTWLDRYRSLETAIQELFGRAVIVVVSYNCADCLKLCLESIWQKTAYPNFEVVVVDNNSEPAVREYLRVLAEREARLKVIFNRENLGFPQANNIGIKAAGDCEYIVLLNNDTVVTLGWLSKLIHHLNKPKVELVGPVTNWAGNEARIDVDYDTLGGMDAFAERYTRDHEGECFDIRVLAMYCVVMRRALLESIGLLDERFGMGMFEDDDFAKRIRKAGGRVICAEDVFVHHWGRASFGALGQKIYDRLFDANRRKYEEKWREPWIPHRNREPKHK